MSEEVCATQVKRPVEDNEEYSAEVQRLEDLVRRHRRHLAEAKAQIVELQTELEATRSALVEAKAATGHMTMLLLRQHNKKLV